MEQNIRFMTLHRLLECRLNLPTLQSAGKKNRGQILSIDPDLQY